MSDFLYFVISHIKFLSSFPVPRHEETGRFWQTVILKNDAKCLPFPVFEHFSVDKLCKTKTQDKCYCEAFKGALEF